MAGVASPQKKARSIRDKLEVAGCILVALAVVAFVGVGVYEYGRGLIEMVGPVYALLVVGATVFVFRMADYCLPRSDGESWFWHGIRRGGE